MQIPTDQLTPETLRSIIEKFVLEEGTDYGHTDYSLEEKVAMVMQQLKTGKAFVFFDQEEETCVIKGLSMPLK